MKTIINLDDARKLAYKRLPRFIFDFVDGGAEDETTVRDNPRAFSEIKLNPRVLIDVSQRDISTKVFGEPVNLPVLLAPAGGARLMCKDAELAAVRATGHVGTVFTLTTVSNYNIEEVAAEATGPLWFQLYPRDNRDDTISLVNRAQEAGYKALCLCVDVAAPGKRERDIRNQLTYPPRLSWNKINDVICRPLWLYQYLFGPPVTLGNYERLERFRGKPRKEILLSMGKNGPANPAFTWDDLGWLRELWQGPLVVKGITNAEDAKRVLEYGVNGIIVSNHGGRQLDGQLATIKALPSVVEAVAGRAEVFIDSGIRRGSDVIKAIALGAQACFIGRPYFYGLAIDGELGVIRVLQILGDEIDRTMALLGCRTLADIKIDHISINKSEIHT